MSVCERVDLPEPLGPITAWTSPLEMPSVTPFRICRPSTLALRSLISKSANFLSLLFHLVSAIAGRLGHPRRTHEVRPQQPLVHLLLALAREAGASGDVLDGAVAVAQREPSRQLDHLGHVAVLGGEPRELVQPRDQVESRQ